MRPKDTRPAGHPRASNRDLARIFDVVGLPDAAAHWDLSPLGSQAHLRGKTGAISYDYTGCQAIRTSVCLAYCV